jgi:hypothetical protein
MQYVCYSTGWKINYFIFFIYLFKNTIITEYTQESGHLQSTELSARLDLFKKLGMIWKARSNRANFIRKNPRDNL